MLLFPHIATFVGYNQDAHRYSCSPSVCQVHVRDLRMINSSLTTYKQNGIDVPGLGTYNLRQLCR